MKCFCRVVWDYIAKCVSDDQELSSGGYATTQAVAQTHKAGLGLTQWFLYKKRYKTAFILNTLSPPLNNFSSLVFCR